MKIVQFAALALAVSNASAFDLKGAQLEMSHEDFSKKFPDFACENYMKTPTFECSYRPNGKFEKAISELNTIANEPVKSWRFGFARNKLADVSILLSHESYRAVSAALTEKYGQPKTRLETLQNGFGALTKGQLDNWQRPVGTMSLSEYFGDKNYASLRYSSKGGAKAFADAAKQAGQKAAKDL